MQLSSAHFCSSSPDRRSELSLRLLNGAFVPSLKISRLPMQIIDFEVCMPLVHVEGIVNNEISCRGTRRKTPIIRGAHSTEVRKFLAPLRLESSEGQALMEILLNRGHVSQAASRQLEHSAAQRQRAYADDAERMSSNEVCLYRRIGAIIEKERARVVQDIMYALVVARLIEADWTMALPMESTDCEHKTDFVPRNEKIMQEALHAPEVRKMVEEHVAMVIGGRSAASDQYFDADASTRICKLRMGKIYAASAMYGYFLRRIYERFKLEQRLMRTGSAPEAARESADQMRAYVGSWEREMQRRHGRVRAEESVQVIERHVEALFGKPQEMLEGQEDGSLHYADKHMVYMKLGALRSLLLEALAMGSALWDVEAFVACSYPLSFND